MKPIDYKDTLDVSSLVSEAWDRWWHEERHILAEASGTAPALIMDENGGNDLVYWFVSQTIATLIGEGYLDWKEQYHSSGPGVQ